VKIIVHVQITRFTIIYYSYFLHTIIWEKPRYLLPGEYCLNVSKQQEYKSSACIILKKKWFQIKWFFFSLYVFNVLCSMLNRCLWCHFRPCYHHTIEKLCYPRRRSKLIRTKWPHSTGLPRGDNHVKLRQ
jgi:hypothetical protein